MLALYPIITYVLVMFMGLTSMVFADPLLIKITEMLFKFVCIVVSTIVAVGSINAEKNKSIPAEIDSRVLPITIPFIYSIIILPLLISLFMGFYITAGFILFALICAGSYLRSVKREHKMNNSTSEEHIRLERYKQFIQEQKPHFDTIAGPNKISVVNKKSWKSISENQVEFYIGRPSPFGNPYVIGKDGDRNEVILKYYKEFFVPMWQNDVYFKSLIYIIASIAAIPGNQIVLVCWCAPEPCHGDIIKKCINYLLEGKEWNPEEHSLI